MRTERMPADTPTGMPCCGVASVAMLANVDFNTAWNTLRQIKKNPGNWKGSSRLHERQLALRKLGVMYTPYLSNGKTTILSWIKRNAEEGVMYEVQTTGHAQVVYNGLIYDQDNPEGVRPANFRKRRKKVRSVTEVRLG